MKSIDDEAQTLTIQSEARYEQAVRHNEGKGGSLVRVAAMTGLSALVIVIVGILSLPGSRPQPPENKIVLHIVPHSHDDLGWVVTEKDYYEQIVSHILWTSTDYLSKNPRAKFTFCDISFMIQWFRDNPDKISLVKKLVKAG